MLVGADMDSSIVNIMKRLEKVFGNVSSGESIFREFYKANQKRTESVVAWALRLEGILKNAMDKGHVKPENKSNMLKNRFWNGQK